MRQIACREPFLGLNPALLHTPAHHFVAALHHICPHSHSHSHSRRHRHRHHHAAPVPQYAVLECIGRTRGCGATRIFLVSALGVEAKKTHYFQVKVRLQQLSCSLCSLELVCLAWPDCDVGTCCSVLFISYVDYPNPISTRILAPYGLPHFHSGPCTAWRARNYGR
jgi:hypothetical protein